jgi:hypothetical protein
LMLPPICRRTWSEVRAGGIKPKPRYGHGLALLGGPGVDAPADPMALVFAGETASGGTCRQTMKGTVLCADVFRETLARRVRGYAEPA